MAIFGILAVFRGGGGAGSWDADFRGAVLRPEENFGTKWRNRNKSDTGDEIQCGGVGHLFFDRLGRSDATLCTVNHLALAGHTPSGWSAGR